MFNAIPDFTAVNADIRRRSDPKPNLILSHADDLDSDSAAGQNNLLTSFSR
jgi:hypothetical protein